MTYQFSETDLDNLDFLIDNYSPQEVFKLFNNLTEHDTVPTEDVMEFITQYKYSK